MEEHVLEKLSRRYPQLLFPLGYDTKDTQEYRNAVHRGVPYHGKLAFTLSGKDRLTTAETPAGRAEMLLLDDRKDFEHCVCALAYQCEPREIPASMGAVTVGGLINWEKIRSRLREDAANDGKNPDAAFRLWAADKKDYTDRIILLSSGWYSAVGPETVGLPAEEWRAKSVMIRQYHELTHFVCRTLFPDDIDVVRDEILADMIGIMAAFGRYDDRLAGIFLGLEGGRYRGGRLENYVERRDLAEAATFANDLIARLKDKTQSRTDDLFLFLQTVFAEIKTEQELL